MNTVLMEFSSNFRLELRDGHYFVKIPTLLEYGKYSNRDVDFIFDTGAYVTVLSRKDARRLDFGDHFVTRRNVPLSGFAGSCLADFMEIPGLIIGNRKLEGVKIAVPHIDINVNILGLNVIEHFKYYVDKENDLIYFADNPKPDIPRILQARQIHTISQE